MILCRKNRSPFFGMLILLCIVFLLHLIITPLEYTQNDVYISNTGKTGNVPAKKVPLRLFGGSLIVADFSGNDTLTNMEINIIINRNLRDFERPLTRIFNVLTIPITSMGILIYSILFNYRRFIQNKSVLAICIGGHAPPLTI